MGIWDSAKRLFSYPGHVTDHALLLGIFINPKILLHTLYIYIYKRFYCKIMNKMFCLYLCVSTAKWFMKGFLFFYRTRTWLTLKTKRLHFGQRHTLKDSFVVMTTIEIQLGQTLKIGNTFSKKTKICGHLRNWTEDLNISNKGITDSKSISITWISEST